MSRHILEDARIHPDIRARVAEHHRDIVDEVEATIAEHDVVVVGMAQNPFPRKAKKALDQAGIGYRYIEYGSYLNTWRRRTALKMWTGWPTFPMIFIRGTLVGGFSELETLIGNGQLRQMLAD